MNKYQEMLADAIADKLDIYFEHKNHDNKTMLKVTEEVAREHIEPEVRKLAKEMFYQLKHDFELTTGVKL